jgi:hypothetical protein
MTRRMNVSNPNTDHLAARPPESIESLNLGQPVTDAYGDVRIPRFALVPRGLGTFVNDARQRMSDTRTERSSGPTDLD